MSALSALRRAIAAPPAILGPWHLPGEPAPAGAVPSGALILDLVALPPDTTLLLHAVPPGGSGLTRVMLRGCSTRGVSVLVEGGGRLATLSVRWSGGAAPRAGVALAWGGGRLALAAAPGGVADLGAAQVVADMPGLVDATAAASLAGVAGGFWVHPAVAWHALHAAPWAPLPAALIAPGTQVDTPAGPRAACHLRPGDAVLTFGGGARPLAAVVPVALPARGSLAPVRLRAGYCPTARSLTVGPRQAVLIDGPGVQDVTGRDEALMVAADLTETRLARRIDGPGTVPMLSLALAEPGLILADGMALAADAPGGLPMPAATRAEAAAIVWRYRNRAA